MAFHANAFGAGAKFRIRWVLDAMIAVAYDTSGQIKRLKCFVVCTLHIHLGLENMTVRANVLDLVDTRRHRAMISMAGSAGGSAQITPYHHGIVMHTGVVLRELIRGNTVWLHVLCVGVTARTCFRHVDGVNRRSGIAGWPYIVDTMTIDTDGSFRVPSGVALAMHTGVVLVQLIRT